MALVRPLPIIITDLDGTRTRYIPYPRRHFRNEDAEARIRSLLNSLNASHGITVSIITDKPGGQIEALANDFGYAIGNDHVAESAGTWVHLGRYGPPALNPVFIPWRTRVRPLIKEALIAAELWFPEPGSKRICMTVVNPGIAQPETGQDFEIQVRRCLNRFVQTGDCLIRAGEDGNIVTITPPNLDKLVGAEWLQRLLEQGGTVDWERSIFLGDGLSDLDAAKHFATLGVRTCAVGNAVTALKEFAVASGGIVSKGELENGFAQVLEWYREHVVSRALARSEMS